LKNEFDEFENVVLIPDENIINYKEALIFAFLGLLRKHRSNSVKPIIAEELSKNLTTLDATTIRSHLPEYL